MFFFLLVFTLCYNNSYTMQDNDEHVAWQQELTTSIINADHATLEKVTASPYFSPEIVITGTRYNQVFPELSLLKFLTYSSAPELAILKTANVLCNKGCTISIPTDRYNTVLSPLSTAQSEKIFTFLVEQIKQNEPVEEQNPELNKVGFLFRFWIGTLKGSSQNLNDDQKNVIIANINKAYPSIEQITSLAAYYTLNGYFPDESNNPSSSILTGMINREYGYKPKK